MEVPKDAYRKLLSPVVVQLLSHVQFFVTPCSSACQASLSITISLSLLKLMSIESVMPSNHLIIRCPFSSCPQSLPVPWSFPVSQRGQSIGVSALASVFPMNIQDCFPSGLTGLISFMFKRLSRVFSSTTVRKCQFFDAQAYLWYNSHICT